jgi:NADPH:quinone reductase-like Zn-dependent oxidoreductase
MPLRAMLLPDPPERKQHMSTSDGDDRSPAPATMKAIVQDTYGTTDVLELRDVPVPEITDDEVLVHVRAAGVDAGVWHLMEGVPYAVRLVSGLRSPKNPVRGVDVAGTVAAVGANVTRFRPGDDVFGTCAGSFAEYARAGEDKLAAKPANLSFEEAAAVPVSACTALQAVHHRGGVRAGQRVLVIGAAGGVGSFAVQIAKAYGAEVTGVCSTPKVELVRALGADHVIDYEVEDVAESGRRYDLIIDIAGNRSLSSLRRLLTTDGTVMLVGGEGGNRWVGRLDRPLRGLVWSRFIRHDMKNFIATEPLEDLITLMELIEAGKVTVPVERTYPLSEVPEAIRRQKDGDAKGKLVITV